MKSILAPLLAAFALGGAASAADAELRGRVTDSVTGASLDGAVVTLDPDAPGEPDLSSVADLFGFYEFEAVPPGGYSLGATHPGYAPFAEARAYAADEIANENIALVPLAPAGSSIDIQIQLLDTRTDVPLSGVPVRVQRFTSAGDATAAETITRATDINGYVLLYNQPKDYYEFRFNHADDGPALKFYEPLDPGTRSHLELDHAAVAKLLPKKQATTVVVSGPDPADPETFPLFLEGFYVELMPVTSTFVPPFGFDPETDDLRDFAVKLNPELSGRTDATGSFAFGGLPPYTYICTATKLGYKLGQSIITPAADGTLPAFHVQDVDVDPGTTISVVLENPHYPKALLAGLPVKLEGLPGTNTEGIEREAMSMPMPPEVVADFPPGLLPGRYRVWVDAPKFTPPTPAGEAAMASIHIDFAAERVFEVAQGIGNTVALELEPVPAKIRGRFFKADARGSLDADPNPAGAPVPFDRWHGPAYAFAEQAGIEFTQSALAPYLMPGAAVVSVDTDAFGNFELTVLPSFYGVAIPSLDGYWGSNYRSVNRTTGETLALGWPYAVDPAATGGLPAHPFASLGIPVSSGDELEMGLFVRKQTYFLDGTVLADTDCPLLDLVVARTDTTEFTYDFSHVAATGEVKFDKDADGGIDSTTMLEPGFSVLPDGSRKSNINARFEIEAPPGTHKVEVATPDYAQTAGLFEIVGLPDYGYVGSGDAGAGDGIIPMEDNWVQLAAAAGAIDPWVSDYKGDHHLLIEFIGDDGGEEVVRSTRAFPDYVENAALPGKLFATGAPFEMAAGTWTIYAFEGGEWYRDTITVGGAPSTEVVKFYLVSEFIIGGPLGAPPKPKYDIEVTAVNAADPTMTVPSIAMAFEPPTGSGAPYYLGTAPGNTSSVTDYDGGFLPLSLLSDGSARAAGADKWLPATGSKSPFSSYVVDIDPSGAKPKVEVTGRFERGSAVHGVVLAEQTYTDGEGEEQSASLPLDGVQVQIWDRFGGVELRTLTTDASGAFSTGGTPLEATGVLFINVEVPGFKPFFQRFTANDGDGAGLLLDFDLATDDADRIKLEPVPAPDILAVPDIFNRAGPFLRGVRKGAGAVFEDDPDVTMTYTVETRSAAGWELTRANFDTPAGAAAAEATAMIEDPVTSVWIVNSRYFPGPVTWDAAAEIAPLPERLSAEGVPDPLYNRKMRARLRALLSTDKKPNHLIARRYDLAEATEAGTGKLLRTATGTLELPDLPPGRFDPYIIAETRAGAYHHILKKPTGTDPQHLSLYGMELPPWLARVADSMATIAAVDKATSPAPFDKLFPKGLITWLPEIEGDISLNPAPANTLKYEYMIGSTLREGSDMPPGGFLGWMGFGGFDLRGDVTLTLDGSRPTEVDLIGKPVVSLRGGASWNAKTPTLSEKINTASYKSALIRNVAGVRFDLEGSAGATVVSLGTLKVPTRTGDTLDELQRVVSVSAGGKVEPSFGLDISNALALVPPPAGPYLIAAKRYIGFGIWLGSKQTVGGEVTGQMTTRNREEIGAFKTNLEDNTAGAARLTAVGEDVLPLPTSTKTSARIFLGQEYSLSAEAFRGKGKLEGKIGVTGPEVTIPGGDKFKALTVHLNRFPDKPNVNLIEGAFAGSIEATADLYITKFKKTLGGFTVPIHVPFNTDAKFFLIPYTETESSLTPATSPAATWLGKFPHLVGDYYGLSRYAAASSAAGAGALVYLETVPGTGGTVLKFSPRAGSTAWSAPAEIASVAGGVLGLDLHELPGGGWMVAWSEIAPADFGAFAPASTVKAATSADGVTWGAPATVASWPSTAFDLRLAPMPGGDLGLLFLASERGPGADVADLGAALFDGATSTWGAAANLFPGGASISGWDLAGPGFAGAGEAQIVAFTDVGGLVAAGWAGGAAPTGVVSIDAAATPGLCAVAGGPDDTFTVLHGVAGGGLAGYRKVGAGGWSPLPGFDALPGDAVGSLDIAPVGAGGAATHLVAFAGRELDNAVGFFYLGAGGAPLARHEINPGSPGHYSDLRAVPAPGPGAGDITALFDDGGGGPLELRAFETTAGGGVTATDRDADSLDDLAELRIVDADPGDALALIDDVLGGDDFDGDGSSNAAELSAGTDPTDPLSFPGQVVGTYISVAEAHEFGSQPAVLFLQRSGETGAALTATYTVGGTATPGVDFAALSGTVSFEPGQTAVPVQVLPLPDTEAEGDESVIVTVAAGAGYTVSGAAAMLTINDLPLDAWRFEKFTAAELADELLSGELADFESDGWPTLIEYAFDSEPKDGALTEAPTTGSVVHPTTGDAHRALAYLRRKSDPELLYEIEVTDDLVTWTPGAGEVEEISVIDHGDGTETVTVRDLTPLGDHSRRFLRVTVTRVSG